METGAALADQRSGPLKLDLQPPGGQDFESALVLLAIEFQEAFLVDIEVVVDIDNVQEADQGDAAYLAARVEADIESVEGGQAVGVVGGDLLRITRGARVP